MRQAIDYTHGARRRAPRTDSVLPASRRPEGPTIAEAAPALRVIPRPYRDAGIREIIEREHDADCRSRVGRPL